MDIAAHDNEMAEQMANVGDFYDWLIREFKRLGLPADARIADVGCGPGALLARLSTAGWVDLTGIDFAERSLSLARRQLPGATLIQNDIQAVPLAGATTLSGWRRSSTSCHGLTRRS